MKPSQTFLFLIFIFFLGNANAQTSPKKDEGKTWTSIFDGLYKKKK